ncbi:MAG: 50S ribosomal protein L10 [Oscillospiraceae bacterium]|jgi:large subunit ribosomal protein L10|nr:50S ribosomal protein L10 [Oscillospiraceae bacterium]
MPSNKILAKKQAQVAELTEKIKNAPGGVFVDYKGINAEDDTKLRKELREAGADYFVVKNTLLKLALDGAGISGAEDYLKGSTAIALGTDVITAPKILYTYQQEAAKKNKTYSIKAGFIDGKIADKALVEEYAQLPSKEVLLSKLLFLLQSPMQRLAIGLSEVAKQKESA